MSQNFLALAELVIVGAQPGFFKVLDVLPVDDRGTWLRYHHLFRDFLQVRMAQEYPDEKDRILRQLASVYARREEWEKAHDLYRRLRDVAATASLVEQAGSSMAQSGR